MKGRFPVLIGTMTAAVLLAFAGVAAAQEESTVTEVWSLPTEAWSSPEGASPQQSTAQAEPQERTFSATAISPSPTALLRQPPFPPTDVSLFRPEFYNSPPLVPDAEGPTDEATLRQQLNSLLVRRFGAASPRVAEGLSIFDAASTKQIVSDPRLRAALVSLLGTIGEPAINGTLDGSYAEARFPVTPDEQQILDNMGAIAVVINYTDGFVRILVNNRFQFEDFRLLASSMAHEPLHRDPTVSPKEEMISDSIDTLVYGQILLESPSLATSGTELARSLNTELMGRLNGRDANGNLRLLTSTGNIYPNNRLNVEQLSYAEGFGPLGNDTPGNAVLRSMLVNVVGSGVAVPANPNFDDATVGLLDLNQNALTDAQVVRLAQILKLNVYPPTVTRNSPIRPTRLRTPTIGATVSDRETNLAKSNIRLFVDGKAKTTFVYSRTTDRLTFKSGTLAFGTHTVRVVATDAQGKSAVKVWNFRVIRR